MKVNAMSPEEAVQLAGSVPLGTAKEALQTDSQPGRPGVFPRQRGPPPRGQTPKANKAQLSGWGQPLVADTKAGSLCSRSVRNL